MTIAQNLTFEALKQKQQGAWASGDYAVVGTTLQIVGEQLCETIDLRSGSKVLDIAAGNGKARLIDKLQIGCDRFADPLDLGQGLAGAVRTPASESNSAINAFARGFVSPCLMDRKRSISRSSYSASATLPRSRNRSRKRSRWP